MFDFIKKHLLISISLLVLVVLLIAAAVGSQRVYKVPPASKETPKDAYIMPLYRD